MKTNRLRSIIIGAGIKGIIALLRQLKYFEQQNGGALTQASFENALIDFQIPYIREDINQIFAGFDRNNDGVLDSKEYIDTVCGPLSDYRRD